MKYSVRYSKRAEKQIDKLNPSVRKTIFGWIEKNLVNCENPRLHGKGLTANRSGEWRYRVGNYRIIADIQDYELIILVIEVGHRKSVYDN